MSRLLGFGLLLVGLLGLAACGDDAPTEPVITPLPTVSPKPTRTATPTPTPTAPVRVDDDPTWTAEQVAAVHTVDAYYEVATRIFSDPANANLGEWTTVSTEPQYGKDIDATTMNIARGRTYTGGVMVIPVRRSVSPEAIVDGRREIHVVQCQADNPDVQSFENGVPRSISGPPEAVLDFTVQWVETAQGWRVADKVKVRDGC